VTAWNRRALARTPGQRHLRRRVAAGWRLPSAFPPPMLRWPRPLVRAPRRQSLWRRSTCRRGGAAIPISSSTPSRRVVVVRRPPPRDVYEPSGPPIGIGIGIGGGGFGGRSGGEGMSRRGGY